MSGLKLNPAIAKENPNGQIFCIVCKVEVKPKVWLAHNNGRKHRTAVDLLKKQLSSSAAKRVAQCDDDIVPPFKRSKEFGNGLPSDFFDNGAVLDVKTPWQKDKDEERKILKSGGTDVIEGVPHGFFDDKRMDNRVRETKEKNAQMEEEYDKFMREINEQQTEDEQKADEEVESEARSRDLQAIDEQMEELRRLNELEIRKEQLLQARHRKKKIVTTDDDDEIDSDQTEVDSWRTKKFI